MCLHAEVEAPSGSPSSLAPASTGCENDDRAAGSLEARGAEIQSRATPETDMLSLLPETKFLAGFLLPGLGRFITSRHVRL